MSFERQANGIIKQEQSAHPRRRHHQLHHHPSGAPVGDSTEDGPCIVMWQYTSTSARACALGTGRKLKTRVLKVVKHLRLVLKIQSSLIITQYLARL